MKSTVRTRVGVLLLLLACAGFFNSPVSAAPAEPQHQRVLSPLALAVSPDGAALYVACATANELLVLDTQSGRTLKTVQLPGPASGLTLSRSGQDLFVTSAAPESTVCVVDTKSFRIKARLALGHTAMAPVLSPDEKVLYVCERFNNRIRVLDRQHLKSIQTIGVEREPVAAALTPDGQLLFVANHLHGGRSDVGVVAANVSVIDTVLGKEIKRIPLCNGSTLLRGICVSPDGKYVAVTHTLARFHLPTTHVTHGWMNDNALTFIKVSDQKVLNTILLDDLELGAANPWSVAWTADGKWIYVTHAGTHELSRIDAPALLAKLGSLPEKLSKPAGSSDYGAPAATISDVPNDLAFLVGLRTRIQLPLNGPRALLVGTDKLWVAGYFSDSISAVPTGEPPQPPVSFTLQPKPIELTAVRKGEMYFNDGTLCYQHWQSCASCHSSDARVDGMNWDLLNDGIGNPKNVKSLLLSFETGPAMAMGVRTNAAAAVRAGIRHILFAVLPEDYPAAIDEYLKSLKPLPSPYLVKGRLSAAAERGRKLFLDAETGCAYCHKPPLFTDMRAHEVGTGKFDQQADRFQTPSLIELWRTAPYLHDGSAVTVHDVLTQNPGDRRGNTSHLSGPQLDDLAAYLLSL